MSAYLLLCNVIIGITIRIKIGIKIRIKSRFVVVASLFLRIRHNLSLPHRGSNPKWTLKLELNMSSFRNNR